MNRTRTLVSLLLIAVMLLAISCHKDPVSQILIDSVDVSGIDTEKEYSVSDKITVTPPSGTTIRYTTDGKTPTSSSPEASGSISLAGLAGKVNIQVVAEKDGHISDVSSFTIKVKPEVKFSCKVNDELGQDESIRITVADGVSVYYTTDGSEVTLSSTKMADGSIPLTGLLGSKTVKVLAVKDDVQYTGEITVKVKLPAPTINVDTTETYVQGQSIEITVPEDATARYTTDGSEPTATTGTEYDSNNHISLANVCGRVTIKAVIIKDEECSKPATVTINVQPGTPVLSDYDYDTKVFSTDETIDVTAAGVTIRYTTDGTDPTVSSTEAVSGKIPLTGLVGSATIKVIAEKDEIISSVNTVTAKVKPDITFDKEASAELGQDDKITITVAKDVTVYYTTDGSTPVAETATKGTEIPLADLLGNTTIKILAVKDGVQSTGELKVYVKFPSPTVEVDDTKSYAQNETVKITVPSGASARYTVNSDDAPTATTGTEYVSSGIPLTGLSGKVTIKAVLVKGSDCSAVKTVTVNVKPSAYDTSSVDTATEYSTSDVITLTPADGTNIRYTTDGSEPTAESTAAAASATSTGSVEIPLTGLAGSVTVKVVAEKDGIISSVSSFTLKVRPSVTFSCGDSAELGQSDSIKVTVADGVSVYYTTDGNDASTSSTKAENGSIPLKGLLGDTVIRILAVKDSVSTTSKISVYVKLPAPAVTVESDKTYSQTDTITVTVPDGTTARYTTDGSEPTATTGTEYDASTGIPLTGLSGNVTVNAVLVKDGRCSDKATVTVKVKPLISYTAKAAYGTDEKITFDGLADNTVVYYTLNGDKPTTGSKHETDGKSIVLSVDLGSAESKEVTVRAIAVKDGVSSDEFSLKVTVRKALTVTYSLGSGTTVGSAESTAHVIPGGSLTLLTADEVSNTGYTLDGWYTADGTYYTAGSTVTVNDALTLTAGWLDANLSYTESEGVVSVAMTASAKSTASSVTISERYHGKSVTKIADGAFYKATALTTIEIPSSVTAVGNYAFASSGLTEITIPATVTDMGGGLFNACKSLSKVTLNNSPDSLDSYSYVEDYAEYFYAFLSNTVITEITVPKSVKTIGKRAFYECAKLEKVVIPADSSLETIGEEAFAYCTGLSQISLPASLKTIGKNAFTRCDKINFDILKDTKVETIGERAFYYMDSLSEITIPATVTSVGSYAFSSNTALQTVTFEDGIKLETLPEYVFAEDKELKKISIPTSVKEIGSYAFKNCYGLESVEFDAENGKLETIGDYAFGHSTVGTDKITEIRLPGTVKSIGYQAFGLFCTASSLTVYINGDEDTTLSATKSSWFTNVSNTTQTVIWNDSVEVTYVYNNGSADSVQYTKDKVAMSKPSNPSKSGCYFWRWTTDAEGNNPYDFSTVVNGKFTLYAQWGTTYSIGSTGPAGGIIFYDVDADNNSGNSDGLKSADCGWKYIEIAPTDANSGNTVAWSSSKVSISTNNSVSTAYDVTYTTLADSKYTAAAAARSYSTGTYTSGWYLPSYVEMSKLVALIKAGTISVSGMTEGKNFWTSYMTSSVVIYSHIKNAWNNSSSYTSDKCYVRPLRHVMLGE